MDIIINYNLVFVTYKMIQMNLTLAPTLKMIKIKITIQFKQFPKKIIKKLKEIIFKDTKVKKYVIILNNYRSNNLNEKSQNK